MKLTRSFACIYLFLFNALLFSASLCGQVAHDPFIIHAIPKCGTHFIQDIITLLLDKPTFHKGLSEEVLKESENKYSVLRIFSEYSPDAMNLLKTRKYKVIAMYRDPRDALISHLFYMRTYAGKGNKRDFFTVGDNFDLLSFDEQLTALILGTNGTESYVKFYASRRGWATNSRSLAIKYEDLIGAEAGGDDELKRQAIIDIANYIGVSLSSERLQYVMDHMYQKKGKDLVQDGKLFSRSSAGNWKQFFKPQHKKLFKKIFGKKIIELGYETSKHW